MDIRQKLQHISRTHTDRLSVPARRRIVREALEGLERPTRSFRGVAQFALAAGLAGALAAPLLFVGGGVSGPKNDDVKDLTVSTVDGHVVLAWTDGNQLRRVVRATSREELGRLDSVPGETVRGEKWVDTRSDAAPLVYYVIE